MPRLRLIEGLPKYEKIDEAKAIADALNIMKKGIDGRRSRYLKIFSNRANSKQEFLKHLERDTEFLHISSHGDRDKNNNTFLYITKKARIYPEEIKDLKIKAKIILLNACLTSKKDMAIAFLDAGNPKFRFFIAPKRAVSFNESFIISLLFYRNAFLKRINLNKELQVFKALQKVYSLKDIKTNYDFWSSSKK
jgi:hypothetical protein